jgi:hypothetical protein
MLSHLSGAIGPIDTVTQVYDLQTNGPTLPPNELAFELYQPGDVDHLPRNFIYTQLADASGCSEQTEQDFIRWNLSNLVTDWLIDSDQALLAVRIFADDDMIKAAETFIRLNEDQKSLWLKNHFTKFATCSLDPEDFTVEN